MTTPVGVRGGGGGDPSEAVAGTRPRVTRRALVAGAGGALLTAAALGRGGPAGATATPEAVDTARTIEHKHGATEVPTDPRRVVTVGLTDQDYVLALGVTPVGVREWFGGYAGALWPWAREAAGDDPPPAVLPVEQLNFEQIAALEPDLILGVNSGLTKEEYATLAAIAPTVAQPRRYADYGAPWQEITRMVGRALGRAEAAEGLIPTVEARFGQARTENPAFEGATALLAAVTNDGSVYVYAEGPAPGFLTALGFALPPAAAALFSGDDRPPVRLSLERLDVLEADVLVLGLYGPEGSNLTDDPVYQQLGVAREGRDVVLPGSSLENGAMTFGSVLSLPFALDAVVPMLAAAIDGDPATAATPTASAQSVLA